MNRISIILIAVLLLSGCSSIKKLDIFTMEVERQPLALEKPIIKELEKLNWIIITSQNAEEVFKKLEEQGIDPVLWGLTDKDFELLAKNFAQIRNKMVETNAILDKYKEYYESETEKESDEQK